MENVLKLCLISALQVVLKETGTGKRENIERTKLFLELQMRRRTKIFS